MRGIFYRSTRVNNQPAIPCTPNLRRGGKMEATREELRAELKEVILTTIHELAAVPTVENIALIPPLAQVLIKLYSL